MVEGRRDYTGEEVEAARAVLLELGHILSEYWDGIVLVGGWVPYFITPQATAPHEGTKDVDLALNPRKLGESGYSTIGEILMQSLYQQDTKKAFRYYRTVPIKGRSVRVMVDFLTGSNGGDAEEGRLQEIQDVMASALHGCDVAFLDPVAQDFTGIFPDGGKDEVALRVASIPSFLVMKGFALHNRGGADGRKDAYDIYYCVKNYPGGVEALAALFHPYLENPLIQEGLSRIAEKFATLEHIGPQFVSDRGENKEEIERLRRDSYEQIQAFLNLLGK
ncbi:MAG: nucleotidyl transferase AbiEii/AbiGii toxin family protein [Armatimonadetes bacterium]|nr:nucleotidyl transferase AbiEii/AbiGii toxin family protein [Armatimonadota bacterium]